VRRPVDRAALDATLAALARAASGATECFLVGGASAVMVGWRESTVDIDMVLRPDDPAILRAIPALKERLQVNIEFAAPNQFIPVPPGWESRSPVVQRLAGLTVRHYDFTAQALAKLERGHERDLGDVRAMLDRGLVDPQALRQQFDLIRPELIRFPAIDPSAFARRVELALRRDDSPRPMVLP
jgi:hypothetical protein